MKSVSVDRKSMIEPLSMYGSIASIVGLGATLVQWWKAGSTNKKKATLDHYKEWLRRKAHAELADQIEASKQITADTANLIEALRASSANDAKQILDHLALQDVRLASMDDKLGLVGTGIDDLPGRFEDIIDSKLSELREQFARAPAQPVVSDEDQQYEDRYREAIAVSLDEVELFGVDIDPSSRAQKLTAAYISLNLGAIESEDGHGSASAETVLAELRSGAGRLLIRGEAGSGKSTLMRWTAIQAATRGERLAGDQTEGFLRTLRIPPRFNRHVWSVLKSLTHNVGEARTIPAEEIRQQILRWIWVHRVPFLITVRTCKQGKLPPIDDYPSQSAEELGNPPDGWARRVLQTGRGLVLIDGVDETPPSYRDQLRRQITKLVVAYPDTYFIVTTRPGAVDDEWLADSGFREALVDPLTGKERDLFVDRWHQAVSIELQKRGKAENLTDLSEKLKKELRENPPVGRLATTPLLAAMICALHRDRQQKLPEAQYELVEALCHMLLFRRERESGLDLSQFPPEYRELSYYQRRRILQRVAHYMVTQDKSALDRKLALRKIADALEQTRGRDRTDALEVLEGLIERSGMLCAKGKDSIDFIHNTFKEYLAARQFVNDVDEKSLVNGVQNPDWDQVLLFSAATPDDDEFPSRIIGRIAPNQRKRGAGRARRLPKAAQAALYRRKMMAVRMRAVAEHLAKDLDRRVHRLEKEVFPPRTLTDAVALSGTRGVERYLRYDGKMGVRRRVACVRALRLMGTDTAREYLDGYRDDENWSVVEELSQAINPLEIAEVLRRLQSEYDDPGRLSQEALVRSRILDLSPLAGLTGLLTLHLQKTPVSDVSPLAGLTGLQTLSLSTTQVSDVSPLAGLTGLQTLDLINTPVSNLSPLAGLTGLQALNLDGTPVSDLSLLAALIGLQAIYLSDTQVTDLSPLAGLTGLQTLDLTGTPVSDLLPLAGTTGLRLLSLSDTPISDVSPLAGLTALRWLYLGGTQVSDVSPLSGLSGLQTLNLTNTPVSDLSPLAGMTGLQYLWLGRTQVSNVSPLSALSGLQSLSLTGTQVTDEGLTHMKGLTGLRNLWLDGTQVTDAGLAHLRGLTGLQRLWLGGTQVTDAGLATLKEDLPGCFVHAR